jgi:hypothetical protein
MGVNESILDARPPHDLKKVVTGNRYRLGSTKGSILYHFDFSRFFILLWFYYTLLIKPVTSNQ